MKLSGLHLLLTYQCTFECDHCFVWGSPWQTGTMTLENVRRIVREAQDAGTIKSIYFEGGEPFMYYATLLAGVRLAKDAGFEVGIVSNSYWATSVGSAASGGAMLIVPIGMPSCSAAAQALRACRLSFSS